VTISPAIWEGAAAELPGLEEMAEEMGRGPAVLRPSEFWVHHNARNLEQISREGFGAFKRTVNTNYFQWEPGTPRGEDPHARVSRHVLARWLRRPDPRVLRARLAEPERSLHRGRAARWHAVCVAALWELARRRDCLGLLDRLEEPETGEPPAVLHRGRRISEDLANSVLELATIVEAGGPPPGSSLVIELGAGYGRFAWLMASAFDDVRYVVCDIPPALAISQRYLTELFPDVPVFGFRPFDEPAAVAEELAEARLAFLLPHQLANLPPLGADLFVNVSSLHEMRLDQIAEWFRIIDRHTRGRFYTKQWLRSVNVWDDLVVERGDYPVSAHWEVLLERPVEATPGFFEAVYRVASQPA
jgi:putative sugar O-methyltransferase